MRYAQLDRPSAGRLTASVEARMLARAIAAAREGLSQKALLARFPHRVVQQALVVVPQAPRAFRRKRDGAVR